MNIIIFITFTICFFSYLYIKLKHKYKQHKLQNQPLQTSNRLYAPPPNKRYQEEKNGLKPDVNQQIRDVKNEENFYAKKPINKEASEYFYILHNWINKTHPRWYLSFEVCMGAFIETEGNAFSAYNSKRVDFLIIDNHGKPKCVIEYHGSGHYGQNNVSKKNAEARMEIKKIILKKARIPLFEISHTINETDKQNEKKKLLELLSHLKK